MGRLDSPSTSEIAGLVVRMETIQAYARLTQDFNPLHVDPDFAARTPMGGVIAHGTMSLGLVLMNALESQRPSIGALELDVRFISPVRVGDALSVLLRAGAESDALDVSVRGADGVERISGSLRLSAQPLP